MEKRTVALSTHFRIFIKTLSAVAILLAFQNHALSEDLMRADYLAAYNSCINDSGKIIDSAISGCTEFVYKNTKKEINLLYKKIYSKILNTSPVDAKKFEDSQRSWLKYRNFHCELAGNYVGEPMRYTCPMKINIQRMQELRELSGE
ncbi:lysozyme inhibitor LprI family protein [Pseudomonas knackmussii]|uniref:lysozyme inhibitor LprI family protein n=1 Tax=Pseudomonas knackmussii TaxID=65741 RepID=UPI003F4A03E8